MRNNGHLKQNVLTILAGATIAAGVVLDAGREIYELTVDPEAEGRIRDSVPCMMAYQTAKNIQFSDQPITKVEATAPVIGHLMSHELADAVEGIPYADRLTREIDEYSQEWCKDTTLRVLNSGTEVAGR